MRCIKVLLLLTALLVTTASAESPRKELLHFEPLFGIAYLPSKVKFDPAPDEAFRCSGLLEPRRKLWLFGKHVKNQVTFYYVYGLVEADFGAGPTGEFEAQSDDGIIVAVSPTGCRDIGAGYALSTDPKARKMASDMGITDDIVSALLSDLVDREVKAFGGADKFLAKVKAAGIPEANLDPRVRQKILALKNKSAKNNQKR